MELLRRRLSSRSDAARAASADGDTRDGDAATGAVGVSAREELVAGARIGR
jgi:hypothetical protein